MFMDILSDILKVAEHHKNFLIKGKLFYGENIENWEFKCDACGEIQSRRSVKENLSLNQLKVDNDFVGILENRYNLAIDYYCYNCSNRADELFTGSDKFVLINNLAHRVFLFGKEEENYKDEIAKRFKQLKESFSDVLPRSDYLHPNELSKCF